mgnify:CR=1 FL=1
MIWEQTSDPADTGPPQPAASAPIAWTPEQVKRLQFEWSGLQRNFAFHPHVRVLPLAGDPPTEYQVQYNLRTLALDDSGQLIYLNAAAVHVWLPPAFPHEPPLFRPMGNLFHPNVSPEGIVLFPPWHASMTLCEAVSTVGMLLAFQTHDPWSVVNESAMEWVKQNTNVLPTDLTANLLTNAGGEPLARILVQGPAALQRLRQAIEEVLRSLLTVRSPAPAQLQSLCRRHLADLSVFLAEDIPADLRQPAREAEEILRLLPGSKPAWDALARQLVAQEAEPQMTAALQEAERALVGVLGRLESLVRAAPSQDPLETMRHIPAARTLHAQKAELWEVMSAAEQRLAEARAALEQLSATPQGTAYPGVLGERLAAESERVVRGTKEAAGRLSAAIGRTEVLFADAWAQNALLQRIIGWRDYADLVERAEALSASVIEKGAAGLQTYYIENESGRFGPFEFEQRLQLGAAAVAVRPAGPNGILVLEADSDRVLGKGDSGTATVVLRDAQGHRSFTTTFLRTRDCGELCVQLDYLIEQTRAALSRLGGRTDGPDTWLRRFADALAAGEAQAAIRQSQQRHQARWEALARDLQAVGPFKNRLALYNLLVRLAESVPRIQQRLGEARDAQRQAEARLAEIVAASNADPDTGVAQIPRRWAEEYKQLLVRRNQAAAEIPQCTRRMEAIAAEVRARVCDPASLGRAVSPKPVMLPALPTALEELSALLTDESIGRHLEHLERLLERPLRPEAWGMTAEGDAAAG